jgi:hypothetical protein
MFGFRDKTLDAEHLAKGTVRCENRIVWRPNISAAQARNAR